MGSSRNRYSRLRRVVGPLRDQRTATSDLAAVQKRPRSGLEMTLAQPFFPSPENWECPSSPNPLARSPRCIG
jgi:hypothetical protein